MNYIINFFESFQPDIIHIGSGNSNLEFAGKNEQLTITRSENAYLFYFSKKADMFRSNLCKEIIMINENTADLKLEFNNQLADYFELKLKNKPITSFMDSEEIEYPISFISQFEEKITQYNNFSYVYLSLKMKNKFPESNKTSKKMKI